MGDLGAWLNSSTCDAAKGIYNCLEVLDILKNKLAVD